MAASDIGAGRLDCLHCQAPLWALWTLITSKVSPGCKRCSSRSSSDHMRSGSTLRRDLSSLANLVAGGKVSHSDNRSFRNGMPLKPGCAALGAALLNLFTLGLPDALAAVCRA